MDVLRVPTGAAIERERALAALGGAAFDHCAVVREQLVDAAAVTTGTDRTDVAVAALHALDEAGWPLGDSVLVVHEGLGLSLGRVGVLAMRALGGGRRQLDLALRHAGVTPERRRQALGLPADPDGARRAAP